MSVIYRYLAKIDESLSPYGLHTEIDGDLKGGRQLILEKAPKFGVTRALDPEYNDLRPGNSYWVKVVDEDGNPVACQADRVCQTKAMRFCRSLNITKRFFNLIHGAPK